MVSVHAKARREFSRFVSCSSFCVFNLLPIKFCLYILVPDFADNSKQNVIIINGIFYLFRYSFFRLPSINIRFFTNWETDVTFLKFKIVSRGKHTICLSFFSLYFDWLEVTLFCVNFLLCLNLFFGANNLKKKT